MLSFRFIQWCLDHLNYWTVALLMTIESSLVPLPSEIVVAPAAYNAAAGELNIWLVILTATFGSCLGANFNYFLALWVGRPIIYKFADSRWGHTLLLNGEKVAKAEDFFVKHGVISTLVGRLIPVVRQLISLPAGLARMNYGQFILFTALGAGIWNGILAYLGYYLHKFLPKEQLMDMVYQYSHEIGYGILIAVILVLAFIVIRWLVRKRRKTV